MKHIKRLGALLIVACLLLTMLPAAFAASTGTIVLTINSATMTVNGTSKQIDENGTTAVLDKGGYTMLPLRAIVESMGGKLEWDATTRSITMVKDGQTVKVTVGSKAAYVNGASRTLAYAPRINDKGRTLVHIRALEMFTGTSCVWDQTNKKVTVTYTYEPPKPPVTTKNYRIDVINQTGSDITSLYYGVSGTWQYTSSNALTTTLKKGATASFYIAVPSDATTKMYDFYTEGAAGTKVYSGLNLYNVNTYATVLLKSGTRPTFQQANDAGITVTSTGDTSLKIVNKYKYDIEELYMATSSSGLKNADNLIATDTVASGKNTTIKIDLDGTKDWYFKAVDEKGKEYTSGKASFSSKTAKSGTLTLSSSGKLSLDGGAGETELTFKNTSSKTIEAIYMAGTKSDVEDADNLLDDDLKADKSVTVDMDLEEDTSWYITVEFSSGSDLTEKSLSFEYKNPASATIEISSSSVKISKEKKSSSSGSGDITLAIVNDTTDQKIYAAYLVEDEDDFDKNDPDEDDLLDGDKLNAGAYCIAEGVAEAQKYDLILYYDTGKSDYYYEQIDLRDADEYGVIYISNYSSSKNEFTLDDYTDDDDEIVLAIYNKTGDTMDSTKLYERGESSSFETIGKIYSKEYSFYVLDTGDYPDITIEWKDGSTTCDDDVRDLDDENCFVLLTVKGDEDTTLDNIDDLI